MDKTFKPLNKKTTNDKDTRNAKNVLLIYFRKNPVCLVRLAKMVHQVYLERLAILEFKVQLELLELQEKEDCLDQL